MALTDVLEQAMDENVLERMPEWFRILREAYQNKALSA
jgi:hypothetical protein